MPILRQLSPVKHKRARLLGKTKMQRDRIMSEIKIIENEDAMDLSEVLRLKRMLKTTKTRIKALQDVEAKRPKAEEVMIASD